VNVHVSVHDVSPAWAPEIEMAVALAKRHGATPALLVVPDFHGAWPLLAHSAFCQRLKEWSREGCETYLHGFLHRSYGVPARFSERVRHFVQQRCVSNREAEFSDVTRDEARFRLEQGERVLARADLPISGFVPPAWSMRRWLVPLLAERGYRFTEDHMTIFDPMAGRSRKSLVLNYATRSRARLLSTLAYCRAASLAAPLFPTRIAIHPMDLRHPTVRTELDHLLAHLRSRFVTRAADLFG
jgi:predicted deacetylase